MLADSALRHPGRMSDLFSSLSAAENFRDLACVGYYNGDTGLAQGFAEAAEAIFSAWQSQTRSNDRLLPPIAYNYRHALELALKQAIRQASACRRLDGAYDPELTPQALEAHFKQKQRHRLGLLAQQLAGLLADLNLDELPPDINHLLDSLHQLDPTGEAFRYEGHLKTSASHVDVTRLVERFRDAFGIIHGGVLAVLDQYADFLHEMREAYIPGSPSPASGTVSHPTWKPGPLGRAGNATGRCVPSGCGDLGPDPENPLGQSRRPGALFAGPSW